MITILIYHGTSEHAKEYIVLLSTKIMIMPLWYHVQMITTFINPSFSLRYFKNTMVVFPQIMEIP